MELLAIGEVLTPKTTALHQALPCSMCEKGFRKLSSCHVKLSFAKQQDSLLSDHNLGLENMSLNQGGHYTAR